MKKLGRILLLLAALLMLAGIPASAATIQAKSYSLKKVTEAPELEGEWVGKGNKTRYLLADGSYLKGKWVKVEDKIYYLNSKGYRAKGWVKYRKKYYYLNKKGDLHFGWLKDKYYLKEDGSRAQGMTPIDEWQYYFDKKTGVKKIGWVKNGKYRYYFLKSGKMKKAAWVKEKGKFYYVDEKGRQLRSKWLELNGKKYYLDSDGVRVTGYFFIKNKGYYFKSNGVYDPKVVVKDEINPKKPMVALTFDDGPGPYTERLLDCLKKNNAKATFFMVGSSVPNYKNAVKRMAKMGCELGNHSYNHANLTSLSGDAIASQVSRTNSNIKAACGKTPTVFRLPYGAGASSPNVLNRLGMPSIYWSIDTRDWANTGSPQHTVNEVLNHVKSGDIVLMHDIHLSTVKAAETIIPALKKRGYQLVTVSQLAKYKGKTTLRSGRTYYSFK